jgi:hypothetical protein
MVIGILLMYRRAGCPPDSQQMKDLLTALSKSNAVETFGFYSRMSFPAGSPFSLQYVCRLSRNNRDILGETGTEADEQTSDNLMLPKH